jgi:hypothetical protein
VAEAEARLEQELRRLNRVAARAGIRVRPDLRLTARLPQVRITPEERELISEYATARGMGMSEYIRTCALSPPPAEEASQ